MVSKRKENETLSETISNILRVAPASPDPEDNEDSTPQVVQNTFDEDSEEELVEGNLRKRTVDLLEDVDSRYAGETGSRRNLADSDEEWEAQEPKDSEDSDEFEVEDISDKSDVSDNDDGSEEASSNDEESENESLDSTHDDSLSTDPNSNFKEINESLNAQVQKGVCVRNQLNIYENLLNIRIQLQKCLIQANKSDGFKELEEQTEFITKNEETANTVECVLGKLLQLQELIQAKSLNDKRENEGKGSGDASPCKKRKLEDYEDKLRKSFEDYIPDRNSIIKKWDNNTRIAVIKTNNNPTYGVVNQIENVMNNKQKLIRKTQLKCIKSKDNPETNGTEEYDPEIFDDSDFYHQLLKDLIESKSADETDPVKLGRQWAQLQNTRNKMKRGIDTRATKGRKIRYTVHNKLVNFMAPIDNSLYTAGARAELCNSLFGKTN